MLTELENAMYYPSAASTHDGPAAGSQAAMMVLDKLGMVRYCSVFAARLFRASAHELIGRSIASLLPQLPLRPTTPGYNVAFATFWAARDAGRTYTAVDGHGGSIPVRISMETLSLESQHQILLNLSRVSALTSVSEIALDETPQLQQPFLRQRIPAVGVGR